MYEVDPFIFVTYACIQAQITLLTLASTKQSQQRSSQNYSSEHVGICTRGPNTLCHLVPTPTFHIVVRETMKT